MELKTHVKVIRAVSFIVITTVLFTVFYRIFYWKETEGISGFYRLKENSCDVLFLGSSHSYCSVDPKLLADEYGIASYNMGDSGQNIGTTYYYLEEALKTQTPKVVMVEMLYLRDSEDGLENGNLFRNTLGMKWSLNSLKNIRYAVNLTGEADKFELMLDIFLKFPVFHSRYKELTEADFREDTDRPMGFYGTEITEAFEMPEAVRMEDAEALKPEQIYWMDRMNSLSKERGFSLVFFIAPYILNEGEMRSFNGMELIASERGIPFINFNKLETVNRLGLDYSVDFRDVSHVNSKGAEKVTKYIGEYLASVYGL